MSGVGWELYYVSGLGELYYVSGVVGSYAM